MSRSAAVSAVTGLKRERPLLFYDLPNGSVPAPRLARHQRGELIVSLGEIDDVSLALQQRRNGARSWLTVNRFSRVVPVDRAPEVSL